MPTMPTMPTTPSPSCPAGDQASATRSGTPSRPAAAPAVTGLRERKRERTRQAIVDAAFGLFAEHGFEAVRITEIAAAADVAPATVFTHFATKEDIFFSRRSVFLDRIPDAVAAAATGAELLRRLREGLTDALHGELTDDACGESRANARILLDSPTLCRGQLPLIQRRETVLTAELLRRAGDRADATELTLFASFVVAIASRAFATKDEALAADRPLPAIRAAVDGLLTHGFDRLDRAYRSDPVLAPN